MQRKPLSDILQNWEVQGIKQVWESTQPAEEFKPLPGGEYTARTLSGELFVSKKNSTPGYKVTFEITDGEHTTRRFWHDLWLTPAAMPRTKRDLAKLGITSLEQLDSPLPKFLCKVTLAVRRDDDGTEYNRVRRFEVIGIEPPMHSPHRT